MAITSQVWTKYPIEDNPIGPGSNYTAASFIDHLIAFFTANTAQWTISSSGTDYLEIKPPTGVGAINENDRILFWGGVTPNSGATAGNTTANATYSYACYAPNAGTTGPDALPSAGDPYTGVVSSKLISYINNITGRDKMIVYQSNDCICIWGGIDSNGTGSSLLFVGRAYNPVGTSTQFPLIAGMGLDTIATWSQNISGPTSNWTPDNTYAAADQRILVQDETNGEWQEVRRINGWSGNQFRNASVEERFFFDIHLGANRSAKTEYKGKVLFTKGGPSNINATTMADSMSTLGYAQSQSELTDTSSTWYLWNE